MNHRAWLRRLTAQLPGWYVWYSTPGMPGRWSAVPAPADMERGAYIELPNRINAATPQELRALARQRYGWDDYCQSCGVLARECGHRQDESTDRHE